MNILRSAVVAVATALTLDGCTSAPLLSTRFPPIAAGGSQLPGKIVWHDLVTQDPAPVQRFYTGLFGWQFDQITSGYAVARNGDRLIGGVAKIDSQASGSHSSRARGPWFAMK